MPDSPRLSIIVVCKNPGARLRTALDSVWAQRDADPELIVIDGGSIDGSREWLEAHRDRIATLISEPDTGVYDAMNKGVSAARGHWLLFLGADDRLAGDRVLSEVDNWMRITDADVIGGEAVFDDGRVYRLGSTVNPRARNFVHHQAAFYRRVLFDVHGRFDTTLAVMADYDFNVRLWKRNVRFKTIPVRVAVCGIRGLSDRGGWRGYREEIAVRHRHFSPLRCGLWDALSVLRWVRKRIVCRVARPAHG